MTRVRLPNNWVPRWYQRPAWEAWEQGKKRGLLVWHRRAGKDDIALHKSAVAGHERIGNYWHMLPEYAQARKAIWTAVNPHTEKRRIDEAFPPELRETTNDHEMFIRFKCGSTWQVVGSDNFKSLVGTPPIGIVFSEWAKANPAAWGYLAPILVENGGWADFITTPEGDNHVKPMLAMAKRDPNWFAQVLTVDDTKFISHEVIEQQRREYVAMYGEAMANALIEQEYWCSFEAPVPGAVWGAEMEAAKKGGRIRDVEYDENFPVYTAWDLGRKDATAIWWFQVIAGEVRILKCHASNLKNIAFYLKLVKDQPYQHAMHWLPHDARAKTLAADGKSILQQLAEGTTDDKGEFVAGFGVARLAIVPDLGKQDGIQAARAMFPRCYFDERGCEEHGLPALRQYRYEWDDDKRCYKKEPQHDWASNPADAFRMMAVVWREEPKKEPPKPPFNPNYRPTLNELWDAEPRARQRI